MTKRPSGAPPSGTAAVARPPVEPSDEQATDMPASPAGANGKLARVATDDLFAQLRHLRHIAAIADRGSIAAAALALNQSASVLTRSAATLENLLDMRVLERRKAGARPTPAGRLLLERFRRIDQQIAAAMAELRALPGTSPAGADHLLHSGGKLLMLIRLAEWGSITEAAPALGLTQPGVSVALGRMERQLGQRLFRRGVHGIVPTERAERLILHAKRMRAEMRHALADLAALDGGTASTMVIGSVAAARATILAKAIDAQLDGGAPLRLQIVEAQRDKLLAMLRSGEVDAVLAVEGVSFDAQDIVSETLSRDPLGMVASPRHPFAGADSVPLDALASARWILPLDGSVSRRLLDRCFAQRLLAVPVPQVQSGDLLVMRRLLARGDMLAFTSLSLVRAELDDGTLVALNVSMPALYRTVLLLRRRDASLPACSEAMLHSIRQAAAGGDDPKAI